MPEFLNPAGAEFWVLIGLVIFLGIVIFVAKAHVTVINALDAKKDSIQSDLDEAARIRAEAQRLLESLQAERTDAERQAREMLASAQEQAKQFEADAKAKLAESLTRRQQISERKIASAEQQAVGEVKAAAADLAIQMAEQVLAARNAASKTDPLIDRGIAQLAAKLQ